MGGPRARLPRHRRLALPGDRAVPRRGVPPRGADPGPPPGALGGATPGAGPVPLGRDRGGGGDPAPALLVLRAADGGGAPPKRREQGGHHGVPHQHARDRSRLDRRHVGPARSADDRVAPGRGAPRRAPDRESGERARPRGLGRVEDLARGGSDDGPGRGRLRLRARGARPGRPRPRAASSRPSCAARATGSGVSSTT